MEVEGEDNKDDEENESDYDDDRKPKKNERFSSNPRSPDDKGSHLRHGSNEINVGVGNFKDVESGYNLDASVTAHKLKEDYEHIRTNGNSNTQKVNLVGTKPFGIIRNKERCIKK
ncbi:hypothetical protein Tco_1147187 [Tanacetum coccineum]